MGNLLTACDQQGPAEQTGETVDEAVQDTQNKVADVVESASDKLEEAGDKIQESTQ